MPYLQDCCQSCSLHCHTNQVKYLKNNLKLIHKNDQIFGKPSKPRSHDPSMFNLLSWEQYNQQQNNNLFIPKQHCKSKIQGSPTCKGCIEKCKLTQKNCICLCNQNNIKQDKRYQSLPSNKVASLSFAQNSNNPYCKKDENENVSNRNFLKKSSSAKNLKSKKNCASVYTNQSKNLRQTKNTFKQSANPQQNLRFSQKNITKLKKKPLIEEQIKKIKSFKNVKSLPQSQHKTNDEGEMPNYLKTKTNIPNFQSGSKEQQEYEKAKLLAIKKFKQTSRDLANTSFLTYFNRPPFQNYGRGNRQTQAGVLYGDYMYSHNIFPHAGQNKPKNQQTYITALKKAKSSGDIRPEPPLTRHLQESLNNNYMSLGKIYPQRSKGNHIPITNHNKLENYPRFNIKKDNQETKRKNSYVNGEEHFSEYLSKDEAPKYLSKKDEIQGKQITYYSKIKEKRKDDY